MFEIFYFVVFPPDCRVSEPVTVFSENADGAVHQFCNVAASQYGEVYQRSLCYVLGAAVRQVLVAQRDQLLDGRITLGNARHFLIELRTIEIGETRRE